MDIASKVGKKAQKLLYIYIYGQESDFSFFYVGKSRRESDRTQSSLLPQGQTDIAYLFKYLRRTLEESRESRCFYHARLHTL